LRLALLLFYTRGTLCWCFVFSKLSMKAVSLFKNLSFALLITLTSHINNVAVASGGEVKVKQSSSSICHDNSSASFNRTKNYTPFDTIAACIADGGRLPKSKTKHIDKATEEALKEDVAFSTLYDRGDWPHWLDKDKDCQNTRHEILLQTSSKPVSFKSAKKCNVLGGEWYDPYSNDTFTISKDLDLDHIVPLKFAHGRGGSKWSRQQKALFANDRDNLILAQASLNRQKGAKGIANWLPPNHPYRCEYIQHFNKVMSKYDLAYIPSEQRIVNRLVKACREFV
jgi:hypothetical protein